MVNPPPSILLTSPPHFHDLPPPVSRHLGPAPWGGLIICENLINSSFAEHSHVQCVTRHGRIFTIARNAKDKSEFAGCCFSPDARWLFVNLQSHGLTLAITGPWEKA